MTAFTAARGLDALIAARFAGPVTLRVAEEIADAAAAVAPDAKTWVTAHDERVRPSHRDTDGQTIPANLRYEVPKAHDDNVASNGVDLARAPRDPNLPIANRINCRCVSADVPGAIARTIHTTGPDTTGSTVTTRVVAEFNRVAESEFPGPGDHGGHWMSTAARAVAEAHRVH